MLRLKNQPHCYSAESWDADNILGGGVHSSGIRFQSVQFLVLSIYTGKGTSRHAVDERAGGAQRAHAARLPCHASCRHFLASSSCL